ncbi:MAG: hypothetical protein V4726_14485 [Verrucomicrobiota bacterium]
MNMKSVRLPVIAGCLIPAALPAATASFDDLFAPPLPDDSTGLRFTTAPGDGPLYAGVVWDDRVTVVGDEYKVDTVTPGAPFFGLPHSTHYFITNESTDGGNGIMLTTNLLLSGAWFGRNEYYGFGGGAEAINIVALDGITPLASVFFALPENFDGQPEPLSFVDTSVFLSLSGVTGYRIDHAAPNEFDHNWIADDFEFVNPVPEPGIAAAVPGVVLLGFAAGRRRR